MSTATYSTITINQFNEVFVNTIIIPIQNNYFIIPSSSGVNNES